MLISDWSSDVCSSDLMLSAANAYRDVLQSAGAFPRDGFDSKIVSQVRKRSGAILKPDSQRTLPPIASGNSYRDMDGDGMADAWEASNGLDPARTDRSEEHTSELQSLMRISYAVFCLKKNIYTEQNRHHTPQPQ